MLPVGCNLDLLIKAVVVPIEGAESDVARFVSFCPEGEGVGGAFCETAGVLVEFDAPVHAGGLGDSDFRGGGTIGMLG